MAPEKIPLCDDLESLFAGIENYDENNPQKDNIGYIVSCFSGITDDTCVKTIEDFQKDPGKVLTALRFSLENTNDNAESYYKKKKSFFLHVFRISLSSLYREKRYEPILYFNILEEMKIFFESKNLSLEFAEILNQLIFDDYLMGQCLTWKHPNVLNEDKERNLKITVNHKDKISNFNDRFNVISNIFNSKRVKNETAQYNPLLVGVFGNVKQMTKSIEVLPFFQNNKLLFNGNKKIVSEDPRFNGKSSVQIYFERFGNLLNYNSIEYLLGTIGLKKGSKIINDPQRLAFRHKQEIEEEYKNYQIPNKSLNSILKSAVKNMNDLNKELNRINSIERNIPEDDSKIYVFESNNNFSLKNLAGTFKITDSKINCPHINGLINLPFTFPPATAPLTVPLLLPNDDPDMNAVLSDDQNCTMVSIDSSVGDNSLLKAILSVNGFKKLDLSKKALKFDYSQGLINAPSELCKGILIKDLNYEIQDFLFGDVEFLKKKLDQECMLCVTGKENFSKFRNHITLLTSGENIIGERNIMRNLYVVQRELLLNFHKEDRQDLKDFPFENKYSCIIENCKRFYFNPGYFGIANNNHQKIIEDTVAFLFNNLNLKRENDRFNKEIIANSLFGFDKLGERLAPDKNIKINDEKFLESIILEANNVSFAYKTETETHEYKSNFQKLVDATTEPILPNVLKLLIKYELISKKKLSEELVRITYNYNSNKNKYEPGFNLEDFTEQACNYLGLETAKYDAIHDREMFAKMLIKKYDIDVTKITLDQVLDKDVLENVALAKELCLNIYKVDGISSNVTKTSKVRRLIKSALDTFKYVDEHGFLKPTENGKNLDEKQPDINNNDQLEDLVKQLKKCFLSQIDGINEKVISLTNKQLDNKDLVKMKDIVINALSGIREHVLTPNSNEMTPAGPKNLINIEFKALSDISKQMVINYNKFMKIYNNKNISELKKEQEDLVKITKSKLINNLKKMVTKQQREWKKFFSDFTNENKNENDLEEFFDKNYSKINEYYDEIVKNIEQYSGNDAGSLNKQASKYIDELKKKIERFDEELKNACNYRKNSELETVIATKEEANVENSKILTNNELESQKDDIKAEEKKIDDCLKNKKTDIYKNISPGKSSLLFDNTQKFLTTSSAGSLFLGIPAIIVTGLPLSFLAIPTGVGLLLFLAAGVRKKTNDKYVTYQNASLEQQIYENTFKKSNQQGNDIYNDDKSVSDSESEEEENNKQKEEKIKNKTSTNLENSRNQTQITV